MTSNDQGRAKFASNNSDIRRNVDTANETSNSSSATAAHATVTRGRASSVDRIVAELKYPRTVVKLVAEYNPTTRDQLLCELKKEEARTRWALTPMNRRRPVEVLKKQLRDIDRAFGFGRTGNEDEELVEVDNIDELARRRKVRRIIDDTNRRISEDRRQVKSEGMAEERLKRGRRVGTKGEAKEKD